MMVVDFAFSYKPFKIKKKVFKNKTKIIIKDKNQYLSMWKNIKSDPISDL